jgi:hypothetical protein
VAKKLELLHVDLMGPISPITPEGERFALTMIDEYSDYSRVVILKYKSEAAKCAINVLGEWQAATNSAVKAIRSDCGTEFNLLETYCRKKAIVYHGTPPYSHQSNGKVERLDRTQEKARPILADANLAVKWRGEALLAANHVRNLSPVSTRTVTPYECMFGVKPSVSHLKEFGSKYFVYTPKALRAGKFHPVSCVLRL